MSPLRQRDQQFEKMRRSYEIALGNSATVLRLSETGGAQADRFLSTTCSLVHVMSSSRVWDDGLGSENNHGTRCLSP